MARFADAEKPGEVEAAASITITGAVATLRSGEGDAVIATFWTSLTLIAHSELQGNAFVASGAAGAA